MSLQPIFIAAYDGAGLETDKKPFLLVDQAWQQLDNAYAWRQRVKKREWLRTVGRLQLNLTDISLGTTTADQTTLTVNLYTAASIPEVNPSIVPGTLVITIGSPDNATFTDNGMGGFTAIGIGTSGTINYITGAVTINFTAATGGASITAVFSYYPSLPVMGIWQRNVSSNDQDQTIIFDTTYAYTYSGTEFEELPSTTPTIWASTDPTTPSDFFWATNYRGITDSTNNFLFFVTNFVNNANNQMQYYNGTTWTPFIPALNSGGTVYLQSAKILLPYFGRLIALNTWEGPSNYSASDNFSNRCRFSQIGDPTATNAWYVDVFGLGGFLDAPVAEAIQTAIFFKNTLIVSFEKSTWQLRYVGEYGLPFIWERISSDFGSESTFSGITFDEGAFVVGDKGILKTTSNGLVRLDEKIPDQIFDFETTTQGLARVCGIRDYQKELVYWTYLDSDFDYGNVTTNIFPTNVLVYNYRNNTWAKFRDTVTFFGLLQLTNDVSWDSENVTWDDEDVTWDNNTEPLFPYVVSGNQQGFIHQYGYSSINSPTLAITGIALSSGAIVITSPNHTLEAAEIVQISGTIWSGTNPGLKSINNGIFQVQIIDENTFYLFTYDFDDNEYYQVMFASIGTYIGGGLITIFPNMYIQTKDFNPFQQMGKMMRLSRIDFLTDMTNTGINNIQIYMNTSLGVQGNLLVGNTNVESTGYATGFITGASQTNPCVITAPDNGLSVTSFPLFVTITNVSGMTQLNDNTYPILSSDEDTITIDVDATGFSTYTNGGLWVTTTSQFYLPGSDLAWHSFYATLVGQYMNVVITYDDAQQNTLSAQQEDFVLNAMTLWCAPAGKLVGAL